MDAAHANLSEFDLAGIPECREWEEAFARVESYLRAHQLESRVRLNQITGEILQKAHRRVRATPTLEPVEAAMVAAYECLEEWMARAGLPGDWRDERVRVAMRLSMVLAVSDQSDRWRASFLSNDPVPDDLRGALATRALDSGPELTFRNMAPAPLEFGFRTQGGEPESVARAKWPQVREAGAWLSLVGFFGAAWVFSH